MTDAHIVIPNLLYIYADLIDAGDFAGAARLFRHGTVLAGGVRYEGEDAILKNVLCGVRFFADGTPRTRHLITNPIIELGDDGETATCRSQYTVLQATKGFPLQPVITGRYHDRFALIGGQWCFTERNYAQIDLLGDLSAHLSKTLDKGGA
jgi:hypothetical protein